MDNLKKNIVGWLVLVAMAASAEFTVDKTVMGDQYWKIWNDAELARINADIDKYRKSDVTIEIDAPEGAEVSVTQISTDFYFGGQTFNFNQLGKKELNERYKALWDAETGLFNAGTVAFYWKYLEPYPYAYRFEERYEDTENFWNNCLEPKLQPHWRRPPPDPVISHLKRGGCRVHGHPLVWGCNYDSMPFWLWEEFTPEAEKIALQRRCSVKFPQHDSKLEIWNRRNSGHVSAWHQAWRKVFSVLSEQEVAALVPSFVKAQQEFLEKRIRDIGARYGSRVDSWDAVNESARDWAGGAKRKWPQGESPAFNSMPVTRSVYGMMPRNYAHQALTMARRTMGSKAVLNVNDHHLTKDYTDQLQDLLAHGADFDAAGVQMHLRGNFARSCPPNMTPQGIREQFARIASAIGNRKIHVTEISIGAPDMTPKGQMVQAIVACNCYRAWFAVEKMYAITWWDLVDGCDWGNVHAGFFTSEMKPKTIYFAMEDLLKREFRTHLKTKVSGGKVSFRGFRGRYHLSWKNAKGGMQGKYITVE